MSGNLIIDIGGSINGDVNGANLAGITIDINVASDIILHGNGTGANYIRPMPAHAAAALDMEEI